MTVKLRMLKEKDIPFMLEWMKDKEQAAFFRFDPDNVTEETAAAYIRSAQRPDPDYHFAVTDEQDEYLGTISLKQVDRENKHAEYAVSLRKCAIGTGVAAEATRAILKYAFDELGLHRVYLNVFSDNLRARRFYEKMGFVFEGEFQDHLFIRNTYKNLSWYAITEA